MYNFKKNAKAYIVTSDASPQQYQIDIYSDITASQTFDEQGYKRKTLHAQNDLHDYAVVNNANPANFSFTTPIGDSTTTPIILELGGTYSTTTNNMTSFDLYIQSDNVIYKLQKCVIESLAFNIEMKSILTVSVSGTASKLIKFGNVGSVTIPGTINTLNRTYARVDSLRVKIANSVLDSIAAVHVDIKNEINWISNNTVNEAITGNMMYPGSFVLQSRTLSGSITQFLTSDNVDLYSDTTTNSTVVISLYYNNYSTSTAFLEFNLPSTVFTRRLNFEELINRVYDFRLNSNPTIPVKPIYKGV